MKNYISILAFLILATGVAAQEYEGRNDEGKRGQKSERRNGRMEAKKIGYITEELELSTEEAQKFWPVYNEFQEKLKTLKEETREKGRSEKDFSDAEAEIFLNTIFEREQKELDLKKRYFKKMETAISKAKIAKLYTIENKFRDKVYRSIKSKMNKKRKGKIK
ncbi:MAG: hypothetical protein ACJA1A_000210 [Saprospiraceae bacterium]|jgi:hypothetical protein|tara:strand:- start:2821 stop:3309 length:489 start_codon:yes stop_codon:yes gene_type:complete